MTIQPPPINMPLTASTSPTTTRTLKYRPIRRSDTDTLLAMRKACGWGNHRVPLYFTDPEQVIWLFFYDRREKEGGERVGGDADGGKDESDEMEDYEEMVAMGGILLDVPDDQQVASRELGIVELTSLFIYQSYQGSGLGNHILHILESLAIELYSCKTLSIDTLAYEKLEDNEWHGEGTGPKTLGEEKEVGEMTRNGRWYSRRGYVECRPMARKYPKLQSDDTTPFYLARFMHKPAVSTEETRRLAAALLD